MSDYLIGSFSPWLVTGLLVVQISVGLAFLPQIIIFFWKFRAKYKFIFLISLLLAGYIRFAWVPTWHRIYFDEDRYLTYAVTFARYGKEIGLDAGTPQKFIAGTVDTVARVTVPAINGWVMRLWGFDEYKLTMFARMMSILQILLIWGIGLLLFSDPLAALFSSVIFAFLPTNVFWAGSIALDGYFVLFSLLAVLGASWYGRKQNLWSGAFLIASTINLLYVRFESFLMIPVLFGVILAIRHSDNKPWLNKKDIWLVLAFTPFATVRALVSVSVLGKTWCCGESTPLEVFQAGYFFRNTIPNIITLIWDKRYPGALTVLALISLLKRREARTNILGVWWLFYFFIYSFYYAGLFFTYIFSGSNGRYFLMVLPPIALLAGLYLSEVWRFFKNKAKLAQKRFVIIIGILLMLIYKNMILTYWDMVYISPYDYLVDAPVRVIHDYLNNYILARAPKNALIVHPLTAMVLMSGRSTVYFATLLENKDLQNFVADELSRGVPVWMWQTHTCDVNPEKCVELLKRFEFKKIDYGDTKNLPENPAGFETVELKLR